MAKNKKEETTDDPNANPYEEEELTKEERKKLRSLEGKLTRANKAWRIQGECYFEIFSKRLYRENYSLWSTYCEMEHDVTERKTYRLMAGHLIVQKLEELGFDILPITESQARELSPFVTVKGGVAFDDRLFKVWEEVIAATKKGGKITAAFIKQFVVQPNTTSNEKEVETNDTTNDKNNSGDTGSTASNSSPARKTYTQKDVDKLHEEIAKLAKERDDLKKQINDMRDQMYSAYDKADNLQDRLADFINLCEDEGIDYSYLME